jgi:exonuclease I
VMIYLRIFIFRKLNKQKNIELHKINQLKVLLNKKAIVKHLINNKVVVKLMVNNNRVNKVLVVHLSNDLTSLKLKNDELIKKLLISNANNVTSPTNISYLIFAM